MLEEIYQKTSHATGSTASSVKNKIPSDRWTKRRRISRSQFTMDMRGEGGGEDGFVWFPGFEKGDRRTKAAGIIGRCFYKSAINNASVRTRSLVTRPVNNLSSRLLYPSDRGRPRINFLSFQFIRFTATAESSLLLSFAIFFSAFFFFFFFFFYAKSPPFRPRRDFRSGNARRTRKNRNRGLIISSNR